MKASQLGTWGTGAVVTETMITRLCSTWLCLTLARSASGTVSLFGCGKIAIPGTRGSFRERTSSMNCASDPSFVRRSACTSCRPRRHVVITVMTAAAMSSGTHPPFTTFERLPARNVSSRPPKTIAAAAIFQGPQCQRGRATRTSRMVSTTRAPVTEIP